MTAPTAPLPVITTNLLEKRERGYLAWVAVANEIAELPLESPPIDTSTHALEIHVEGYDQPLIVLADPMGAPTSQGFPLRLKPLDETQENALRAELFSGGERASSAPEPKPNHKVSLIGAAHEPTLSTEHANTLNRMTMGGGNGPPSTLQRRAPGSLHGRVLGDGRFVLENFLGGGASGEVYRAVHTALRRPVAVKVLHPSLQQSQDFATRFYAEALAASRLDHRNVLRVIDYGQEPDGLLYIVMELLQGVSLMDLLTAEGPMPEARIVELVSQACAGLAHAHDAGVIHRDIKPENILVVKVRDDEGRETECVKVCDFGIAQWSPPPSATGIENDPTLVTRPDASKIVGTPGYMAPEQIQNDPVDARTDVYALGVVMYELSCGRVPFLFEDPMEILTCHMVETPEPPSVFYPGVSRRLEKVIMKALEKEPASRQHDMRDLRAELRRLVDDEWSSPSGMFRKISIKQNPLTPSDFVNDTANALGVLHDVSGKERVDGFAALSEALKIAAVEGRLRLARDLVAWLATRLQDPGLPEGERDLAVRAVRVLRDPEVARAHAVNLLDAKIERNEDAIAMLREGGPLAARALIDARRVRPASLELRAHFVALLRSIGPSALSVVISALEPLTNLATRHDEALAEDLLRGLPDARSDAAGEVTVRFVRLDKPTLGLTALRATTNLWGVRARPLLVGVLDAQNDQFRGLAIEELHRLGCIDDVVVERLGRILLGQNMAGDELKLMAAGALAASTREARTRATGILVTKLAPEKGLMSSIRSALGPREDARIVVALARSLFALDPGGSRGVLERFANARPELRPHVEAILAGR